MKGSRRWLSLLCVAAAGCLWGSMGLFVRTFNAAGLSAMQIVEIRSAVTAVLLLGGTVLRRSRMQRIRWRDLWCFLGTGIGSILFFNFCYFRAMSFLSLSAAAVLLYTAPVFVMLLSALLFREKMTRRKVAACVLAVLGCALVGGVTGAQGVSLPGLLLGLGAGLGYALYSIFSRFALDRGYSAWTVTTVTFVVAAVGGAALTDFGPIVQAARTGGATTVGFWLLYAVVTTVLPYLLYTYGLRGVENSVAAVVASVEPVVATLLGALVFTEWPSWPALAGTVLVLAAVCLLSLQRRKTE